MPLPVVNPEIMGPFLHDCYAIRCDEERLLKLMDELNKENPTVLKFIKGFSEAYNGQDINQGDITWGMLLLYKLLEAQQEVNDLERGTT